MKFQAQPMRSVRQRLVTFSKRFLSSGFAASVAIAGCALVLESSDHVAAAEPASLRQEMAAPTLSDGVYLYGESPKPDQIGKGYFVFEVTQGQVVGALYMPRSSFDCASGAFLQNQLALTVVNSYDRVTNPFEIALEKNYNVASGANPANVQPVELQGFYKLNNLSDNDKRMLATCKADMQKQAHK